MENRIIKFRAWATESRKMINLKAITPLACDPGLLEHGDGLFIPFRKDIILMQFTGLKDKNGKEIFEGDVVLSASGKEKYVVIWEHSGWFTKSCAFGQNITSLYPHAIRQTIIGNIYENPELVK